MPPGTSLPHLNAAQRSDAATRSNATIARRVLQPHDSDSDTDVEELTKNPYALRVEQENKVTKNVFSSNTANKRHAADKIGVLDEEGEKDRDATLHNHAAADGKRSCHELVLCLVCGLVFPKCVSDGKIIHASAVSERKLAVDQAKGTIALTVKSIALYTAAIFPLAPDFLRADVVNHPCEGSNRSALFFYCNPSDIDLTNAAMCRPLLLAFMQDEFLRRHFWRRRVLTPVSTVPGDSGFVTETPDFPVSTLVGPFKAFVQRYSRHPTAAALLEIWGSDSFTAHWRNTLYKVMPTLVLGKDENGRDLVYVLERTERNQGKKDGWMGIITLTVLKK